MTDFGGRTGIFVSSKIHTINHRHHAIQFESSGFKRSDLKGERSRESRSTTHQTKSTRSFPSPKIFRKTHLDSMMIRSGVYLSRISTSAFSTSPTMVQHLYLIIVTQKKTSETRIKTVSVETYKQPLRISETPVICDCEAMSESTVSSQSWSGKI